ncbi:hypothetical protein GCM10010260_01290 [Streptomyces filipinensis]|uniref:Sialidase domain-containing protein n=1 Tax=Streptomyces filipinensis TaxID=66887 RepID=A0A918M8T9_9ACTN|nr:hypothetical protein GCM10010260_01290 [Streptomyces filipinensis]
MLYLIEGDRHGYTGCIRQGRDHVARPSSSSTGADAGWGTPDWPSSTHGVEKAPEYMTMRADSEAKARFFTDSPLMTIRVSRDSGKTWGPETVVFARDDLPPLITTEWPPCQCRRCEAR